MNKNELYFSISYVNGERRIDSVITCAYTPFIF